jgi:hypothetical protein
MNFIKIVHGLMPHPVHYDVIVIMTLILVLLYFSCPDGSKLYVLFVSAFLMSRLQITVFV